LPDWKEVRGYFEQLDRESGRVVLQKVGATTEGRDFVLAVISSEENLGRIEALKGFAATCSDPRGKSKEQREAAVENGRPFVFISCAMHATECAAPQFAMQLAWELATSDQEPWPAVRANCVVLLAPEPQPGRARPRGRVVPQDGQHALRVERAARALPALLRPRQQPRLVHAHAEGDAPRDAAALRDWQPQVYWDVHQQGSKAERLFVPPFRDPLDPNIDPGMCAA
jgi:hypothetical protein